MSEYIGNAKIVKLLDLPWVGHRQIYLLGESVCIQVKIKEILNDYIIYEAEYCETESINILEDDFHWDCYIRSYAVSREEFEGRSKQNVEHNSSK